ncbi:MAG: roadblock/LC7 domain-containing protein [Candidatus Thorarchaeota archaeon]
MSNKMEHLEQALGDLKRNCDVTASAIVTGRGQVIWSFLPQSVEEKAVSAMAAAIMSIGARVGRELGAGEPKSVLIDGIDKTVILKGSGNLLVVGIAPYDSEIALVDFELSNTLGRIVEVMEES